MLVSKPVDWKSLRIAYWRDWWRLNSSPRVAQEAAWWPVGSNRDPHLQKVQGRALVTDMPMRNWSAVRKRAGGKLKVGAQEVSVRGGMLSQGVDNEEKPQLARMRARSVGVQLSLCRPSRIDSDFECMRLFIPLSRIGLSVVMMQARTVAGSWNGALLVAREEEGALPAGVARSMMSELAGSRCQLKSARAQVYACCRPRGSVGVRAIELKVVEVDRCWRVGMVATWEASSFMLAAQLHIDAAGSRAVTLAMPNPAEEVGR